MTSPRLLRWGWGAGLGPRPGGSRRPRVGSAPHLGGHLPAEFLEPLRCGERPSSCRELQVPAPLPGEDSYGLSLWASPLLPWVHFYNLHLKKPSKASTTVCLPGQITGLRSVRETSWPLAARMASPPSPARLLLFPPGFQREGV